MNLKTEIPNFLNSKLLSDNSISSYTYDLQQFASFFAERKISEDTIKFYRRQINGLSPAAQKRKISAINQYLLYLYQRKILADFYRLEPIDLPVQTKELPVLRDLSGFYGPIQSLGQFLACLILETGLTPAEIQKLHWSDFNWRFNILEINQNGNRRVIGLQNKFATRAKLIQNADELFSKTRQFMHVELKKFSPYTARDLREQYILRQVKENTTIYKLADLLGLKTIATLEKYYKKGGIT